MPELTKKHVLKWSHCLNALTRLPFSFSSIKRLPNRNLTIELVLLLLLPSLLLVQLSLCCYDCGLEFEKKKYATFDAFFRVFIRFNSAECTICHRHISERKRLHNSSLSLDTLVFPTGTRVNFYSSPSLFFYFSQMTFCLYYLFFRCTCHFRLSRKTLCFCSFYGIPL